MGNFFSIFCLLPLYFFFLLFQWFAILFIEIAHTLVKLITAYFYFFAATVRTGATSSCLVRNSWSIKRLLILVCWFYLALSWVPIASQSSFKSPLWTIMLSANRDNMTSYFLILFLWFFFLAWSLWLKLLGWYWLAVAKVRILLQFSFFMEMHPTFPYSISCWLSVFPVYIVWLHRRMFLLYTICLNSIHYCEWMLYFIKCFFCIYLFFRLIMRCTTFVVLCTLYHLWIPKINPTWSLWMIWEVCCCIWSANILLMIFCTGLHYGYWSTSLSVTYVFDFRIKVMLA